MSEKCFIYARKSVDTGKGESIENQIEMCKDYFKGKPDIEFRIYHDKGFSGKNTNRPHFQQMRKDIKAEKPKYLICYRLDRISRSVSDFAEFFKFLESCGTSFISLNEKFDSSGIGKAMLVIAAVFAQLERDTIAERVRDNMYLLARTGRWLGGAPPFGYKIAQESEIILEGKVSTVSTLAINDDEIETVKTIFAKFLETKHYSAVGKYLADSGIRSRKKQYFEPITLRAILSNPVYAIADNDSLTYFEKYGSKIFVDTRDCDGKRGLMSYGKRNYSDPSKKRNSKSEWIISLGKHEGVVSGADWVRVQEIIKTKSDEEESKNHTNEHNDYSLLSGKIICKKCKAKMFAKRRSGKNANPKLYDYVCSTKLKYGKKQCDCENLSGMEVDDKICEYLLGVSKSNTEITASLNKLKKSLIDDSIQSNIKELEKELKDIAKKRKRIVDSIYSAAAGEELIRLLNQGADELKVREQQIEEQLYALRESAQKKEDKTKEIQAYISLFSTFESSFDKMNIYEKRELIGILIKEIEWDGKELRVFKYGE